MAIDTENKRRSTFAVLPAPDGTIGAADRVQVLWIYSGITISEAAAEAAVTRYTLQGTNDQKFELMGTDTKKFTLRGIDADELEVIGA